jgi:hypothetical protein
LFSRTNFKTTCLFSSNLITISLLTQFPYGGPGGSRTRVQNTFLFASYSNILHYILILCCRQYPFCKDLHLPNHL